MIQNITVGTGSSKKEIELDTDRLFSGRPPEDNDGEKNARRALNLPITKQLVYYPNKSINETIEIDTYEILEVFSDWWTLLIHLDNGTEVKIHNLYLKEMQSPTFISDMQRQEG